MQQSSIKTACGKLQYTITHRPRVTKRLYLELDDSGDLVIVAPKHWSRAHIRATLSQNPDRVRRFLANARKHHLPPLRYVQGEQHLYLGEFYALALVAGCGKAQAGKARVKRFDRQLHIQPRHGDMKAVKSALANWYCRQALDVFTERVEVVCRKIPWVESKSLPVKPRRMRRSWGNCSTKGVIKLNTHLVKAPLAIIDSVITHELCHLQEMNHGKAFYALLERMNPNWRQDRAILRSQGHIYLHT